MDKKNPIIFILSGKARSGKTTVTNLIIEYYNNQNLKAINLMYAESIKNYAKKITNWNGSDETKPRTFLQTLGTEIIRNKIDDNFFTRRMIEDIHVYSYFYDVIIISDARFKNEIEVPKQNFDKVVLIKIENHNMISNLTKTEESHISENALNDFNDYNYIINNDSSIEELKTKVYNILDEVK